MKLHALNTEKDYSKALAIIDELLHSPEGSAEEEELDRISIMVAEYESKHYGEEFGDYDDKDPVDALNHKIEDMGMTVNDLVPYIGSKTKVSEILEKKKKPDLAYDQKAA